MSKAPYKFLKKPQFNNPSLFAVWSEDDGSLEKEIAMFLTRSLKGEEFCRIEPSDFFALDGVQVNDDLAGFPDSTFYSCEKDVILFTSDPPQYEWYNFLTAMLDVAVKHCKIKEIYTVGRMISIAAHTTPRELLGIFTSNEIKDNFDGFGINKKVDYQTPADQRPTLSTFLLWAARKRGVEGVNLWVSIPFYLSGRNDLKAKKKILEFLDRRLELGIDFTELDEEIKEQGIKIASLQKHSPEVNEIIRKLESGIPILEEESVKVVREMEELLGS